MPTHDLLGLRSTLSWTVILGSSLVSLGRPLPALGCQLPPRPPGECGIHVELVALTPSIASGETIAVEVTVTNAHAPDRREPAFPYQNDRLFHIEVSGCDSRDPACLWGPGSPCPPGGGVGIAGPSPDSPGYGADVVDGSRFVLLDDAWAPVIDGPAVATEVFLLEPREPWWPTPGPDVTWPYPGYSVEVVVSVTLAPGRVLECRKVICIEWEDPMDFERSPTAEFVDAVSAGPAGSELSLSLRVSRGDYPGDGPLTVRVLPRNDSDPLDIFPLFPVEITTTGVEVTGDEALLEFSCGLHAPCFVSARNDYDVTISDGSTVLWDSRIFLQPLGSAAVSDAPMASLELIEILGAGSDGRLVSCESGTLHLRATARAASFATALTDVVLNLPLPAGLRVSDYELHFPDNPLDSSDPTPEQLAADGEVTVGADFFRVDVPRIEARFADTSEAPEWFADLFEIELFLEIPAGGLGDLGELVFENYTVDALALGHAQQETAPPLRIPVGDFAPRELSAPSAEMPLRFVSAEEGMIWSPGEAGSGDPVNVYRGLLSELSASYSGDCIASLLSANRHPVPGTPGVGAGFFYLVAASNCVGPGPLGHGRAEGGACP